MRDLRLDVMLDLEREIGWDPPGQREKSDWETFLQLTLPPVRHHLKFRSRFLTDWRVKKIR